MTVIAVSKDGRAEVFIPKQADVSEQIQLIKQNNPEATVNSGESPKFLTIGFSSVRFAQKAKF